jgi:signal recognition particle subunit SEC65
VHEIKSKRIYKFTPQIKAKKKSHSLQDSVLHNLTTKKKLEKALHMTWRRLEKLANDENYRVFDLEKDDAPIREIQAPKIGLDILQTRIANLLMGIAIPVYIHSGVKGKSYITNARMHIGDHPVLTMDIRRFYSSVSQKSIYHFFHQTMKMSPDVAGLVAKLCVYQKHLPTGSRISMPLSFWANHQMFNQLHLLCEHKNITMSVYVDDLTFSGQAVNRSFEYQVKKIIKNAGLTVHLKKTHFYPHHKPKTITGVIVDANGIMNKHHKAIYNLINELKPQQLPQQLRKKLELIGRLNAASQIEPKFKRYKTHIRESLRMERWPPIHSS